MSTEPIETNQPVVTATDPVAKHAPTEQQNSQPGTPKRFAVGQTVCNEKNEKGKLCNGHLKEMHTAHPSEVHLRGDDALHQCQTCGALYMGPPMGHVRDPRKQRRYIEKDLAAILRAAGGTLPAYDYPTQNWKPPVTKRVATSKSEGDQTGNATASHAAAAPASAESPAPTARERAAARPTTPTAPTAAAPIGDETPEQKRARLAAEFKAKYAGAVKPAKKSGATDSSGTPEESAAAPTSPVSPATASSTQPAPAVSAAMTPAAEISAVPAAGETPEQKRERLKAEFKAKYTGTPSPVKKAAAQESSAATTQSGATATPAAVAPGSSRSIHAHDSSASADEHRPAAEAQAATGQASAAPMSPAAATASPAAGAETVSDLAPEASTELTPGAPADERPLIEATQSVAPPSPPQPAPRRAASGSKEIPIPAHLLPPPGETMEEKIARLKAQIEAARNRSE